MSLRSIRIERMSNEQASLLANLLRQALGQGHCPALTVSSDSMNPLLRKGDRVYLEPAIYTQLQPGDIITVAAKSQFLTHRFWFTMIEHGKTLLATRGDRTLMFDGPWREEDLIGRVIARQRNGRYLNLVSGIGSLANGHLAWLAKAELRALNLVSRNTIGELSSANQLIRALIRLIRFTVYVWETAVMQVVGMVARIKREDVGIENKVRSVS